MGKRIRKRHIESEGFFDMLFGVISAQYDSKEISEAEKAAVKTAVLEIVKY